jgi:hypothetical protein
MTSTRKCVLRTWKTYRNPAQIDGSEVRYFWILLQEDEERLRVEPD